MRNVSRDPDLLTMSTASERGIRATQIGILVNAGLAVTKFVGGFLGHSYALVADAVESMADVLSSLIVWRGLHVASRSPDDDYPFGYGKAEPLAGVAVAMMLVAAALGIALQAAREIRTPHEWIPPAYETVTVVTKDGQKIRGVKKNEDAFSIQVMDMRERIQGYLKSNVEVQYDKNSLMPAFDPKRLSDSDLSDLVGYLGTLRGYDVAVR